MKANELRIGNFVYFKHCDYDRVQPRIIDYTLKPNYVGLEGVSVNRIEYNNIEPIPLTEKWLVNLGFIKLDVSDPFYIHSDFMSVKISLDLKMIAFNNLNLHQVKFDFVHQLQNLFFCLTGEQLTLKQC